jgi:signal transduction histidine kinase
MMFVSIFSYYVGKKYSVTIKTDHKPSAKFSEPVHIVEDASSEDASNSLMEHSPFAYLCVSSDLIIEKTVNQTAEKLFATRVLEQKISELLFEKQPVLQESFDIMLASLFEAHDEMERDKIINLLPDRVNDYGKSIHLNYYFDEIQGLFVYLSDVSLISSSAEESKRKIAELEMVIQVLKNQKDYIELKMQLSRLINEELEHFFTFAEDIHTFKSFIRHKLHSLMLSAVSLGLKNSVTMIEYFEESLDKIPMDTSVVQMHDKLYKMGISNIMEEDRKIISNYVDEEKLDARYFTVDHEAINQIEMMIKALPESEQKSNLMNRIKTIRFVNIVDIVARFDKYALDLSKKLNKKVYPIQFIGEKVLIDEAMYKEIIVGFIELVTNALDHGIEFPGERFKIGKPEHGTLTLGLTVDQTGYRIRFTDDGKGVDVNAIKNNLYETKRFGFDEIVQMTDSDVLDTIFMDGVFNMNEDAYHFNKGTGLFLLKERLENMGGTIQVSSKQNKYTTFDIYLPSMKLDA